jgi:hypothetical protein
MLHAANNLVSLGRSIGLRIVLISQRPAKLHKDSLTQVETLVAMRLIAPQDRDAVADWIADQADKEQGKEIVASLPVLKTGDAWIWSPEAGVLERAHFPLASTYDSGKAPEGGAGAPELKPLDLAAVNALLDQAAADIKANDPRQLKGESRPPAARARRGAEGQPRLAGPAEELRLATPALRSSPTQRMAGFRRQRGVSGQASAAALRTIGEHGGTITSCRKGEARRLQGNPERKPVLKSRPSRRPRRSR